MGRPFSRERETVGKVAGLARERVNLPRIQVERDLNEICGDLRDLREEKREP